MNAKHAPVIGPLKVASITRTILIPEISLSAGESVTVWLRTVGSRIQVECHVDGDGTARVLVDRKHLGVVAAYDDVYGATSARKATGSKNGA